MAHPNARLTPAARLEMAGGRGRLVRRSPQPSGGAAIGRRARPVSGTVPPLRAPTPGTASSARAPQPGVRAAPHWALGIARSTAYAVLRRFGLNRLLHRVSRRTLRYEHPAPGDLLHIDEAGPHPRGRWAPRARALRRDPAHPRPRLPPRRRRRPQPLRLRRRPARRARRQLRRLPRAGARRLRPPWRARARRAHGQRKGLHRLRHGRRRSCGTPGPTARRRTARPSAHPDPAELGQDRSNAERLHALPRCSTATSPATRRYRRGCPRLTPDVRGKNS